MNSNEFETVFVLEVVARPVAKPAGHRVVLREVGHIVSGSLEESLLAVGSGS